MAFKQSLYLACKEGLQKFHTLTPADNVEGEGPGEGGGSQKELGKGPGVVDLQRCWGFPEQSYKG